jgi:DNA helicase IV
MSIDPQHLISPAAFFAFAQDDPDRWEHIRGRKSQHRAKGVEVITSIVKVTHDGREKKYCDGVRVAFNDNQRQTERFNLIAFADGTFTAFLIEPQVVIEHIRDYLRRFDLAEASRLYDCYKTQLQQLSFDYESAARPYLTLRGLLGGYRFSEADAFIAEQKLVDAKQYEQTKANYLLDYFRIKRGLTIDCDKCLALTKLGGNVLVTARAGSGKTTLLTRLTSLLVDKYGIDPRSILVLAFNRKAAEKIGKEIATDLGLLTFANARTFHSLAFQLVQPTSKILYDRSDELFAGELSQFVQHVLRRIWNPAFQAQMYLVFRAELQELERTGSLLDDRDFLTFRRSLSHVTLAGEYVKSQGEKIIADFLFEHGIGYRYEHPVCWGTSVYRPDFTIVGGTRDIIIEHWALDPADPHAQLPSHWTTDAQQYRTEVQEKRRFWKERQAVLIETSTKDLRAGRGAFEHKLRQLIETAGIPCRKLPDKDLERKVAQFHVSRMTRLFGQFIQKCKKKRWDAGRAALEVNRYRPDNDREQVFINLAVRLYAECEKALQAEHSSDFDLLMESAVGVLNRTQGGCSVRLDGHELSMRSLKWVLIDEYQDFAPQFFALLQSLRQHNPNIRLFCVGDDWQAINRFTGSDLSFFVDFGKHFEVSYSAALPTNYRSRKAIVEAGNRIMYGKGIPGTWLPDKDGGEIHQRNIDEVWIECRPGHEYATVREADRKFRFLRTLEDGREVCDDAGEIVARYFKFIYEIITDSRNAGKDVAMLSRTNRLHHLRDLSVFMRKLKSCFTPQQVEQLGGKRAIDRNVRIGTVHSFKGLDADIVFVLRACERVFPLIHPDFTLLRLFGDSEQHILEDER